MALSDIPILKKILIGGIAVLLVSAAIYLFYSINSHKAIFVISGTEIGMADDGFNEVTIRQGGRVYFWFGRKKTLLDATSVRMTIAPMESGDNQTFDITYGTAKDFAKISSFIPGDYFTRQGKYKIRGYMDGDEVNVCDVTVTGGE